MVDITRDKPIKVTVRVVVPVRDHPKFNFVGKLLGPKGNSLKRLQEDTMTKMAILGRGSMRDKHKEEELRCSGDPKFSHLNDDLHVEITAFAPPAEAHARIAYALAEVRRFLVPDYNDEIRQEQMWEMQILNTTPSNASSRGRKGDVSGLAAATAAAAAAAAAAVAAIGDDGGAGSNHHHHHPQHHHHHSSGGEHSCSSNGSLSPSTPPAPSAGGGGGGASQASSLNASPPPAGAPVAPPQHVVAPVPAPALAVAAHEPALHPMDVVPAGAAVAAAPLVGRKRPLLPGGPRPAMSPTKRTVLSILARARAAQAKDMAEYPAPVNGCSRSDFEIFAPAGPLDEGWRREATYARGDPDEADNW